jgi:surface antigen
MKRFFIAPMILALAIAGSSGCQSMGPKETGGTVIGGATGALIGSQIGSGGGRVLGVAIGALAGGLVGREIGTQLDRRDQLEMERSAQYSLEHNRVDEPYEWRNPDTGHYGHVTPKKTYKSPEGRYCREYLQTVYIGGSPHEAYGTACRQPDGSWKIVK